MTTTSPVKRTIHIPKEAPEREPFYLPEPERRILPEPQIEPIPYIPYTVIPQPERIPVRRQNGRHNWNFRD